jgi:DNA-binding NarL/FixJ family response regulator
MNVSETKTIRVLIVDDHPMVREGLGSMLDTAAGMEVVGEAGTGAEAIAQAKALQPDIVLLDLQLPDVDGLYGFHMLIIHSRFSRRRRLPVHNTYSR